MSISCEATTFFKNEWSLCHLRYKMSITLSRFNIYYFVVSPNWHSNFQVTLYVTDCFFPSQGKHLHRKKTELFILLNISCDHTILFIDTDCNTSIGLVSRYINFWLTGSNSHMNVFYSFKYPTRCSSLQSILFHCEVTLHVSGILHAHHQEYNFNCIYSLGYKS